MSIVPAKYAAGKFQEALRRSETLGVPNMFRTSICCDLLGSCGCVSAFTLLM